MFNRVTLAQLTQMPTHEAASLPVEHLAMLLEDVADLKDQAKKADAALLAALDARYGENARAARRAKGIDTGRVRLADGEFEVHADLPKDVDWDAAKLREAVETIRSWQEDPAEYVSIKITVPERKYEAWPSAIRKLFDPARTVGTGRPSYKLVRKQAEAA